jgi:hypothetical protein
LWIDVIQSKAILLSMPPDRQNHADKVKYGIKLPVCDGSVYG